MAAKAVVRDVARVQGKAYGLADKLSKMIPFEVGMTLAKALEQEEPLRDFLRDDSQAQEIWDMAVQLEGNYPQRGQARRGRGYRAVQVDGLFAPVSVMRPAAGWSPSTTRTMWKMPGW